MSNLLWDAQLRPKTTGLFYFGVTTGMMKPGAALPRQFLRGGNVITWLYRLAFLSAIVAILWEARLIFGHP
jgi:hypothetical protein